MVMKHARERRTCGQRAGLNHVEPRWTRVERIGHPQKVPCSNNLVDQLPPPFWDRGPAYPVWGAIGQSNRVHRPRAPKLSVSLR